MKHFCTTLVLIALLAASGAVGAFLWSGGRQATPAQSSLEWLRQEFALTEAQFAAVRELHEAYAVVCETHCQQILEAARERQRLEQDPHADTSARAVADRRLRELRQTCETAIATHVRQVATHMSADQASRYLALVLPKVADFDHRAAPDVSLGHRH